MSWYTPKLLWSFIFLLLVANLAAFWLLRRSSPSPVLTPSQAISLPPPADTTTIAANSTPLPTQPIPADTIGLLEQQMQLQNLVNIQSIDPTLHVALQYADTNNFLRTNVYGSLRHAYLQPIAAKQLSKAQEFLRERYPKYTLLVLDAARPRSVQQKMWNIVKGSHREHYVAPPNTGSMHNYGMAVDITIADNTTGKPIDMGTPFDTFNELSEPRYEKKFLDNGKLSPQHIANRALLRAVMKQAGFRNIQREWWHFEAADRHQVRLHYKIIE